METTAAIEKRRAIKHYDKTYQIPESDVEQLFRLVLLSPTAYNIQNWRFVHVRDPELRAKIRQASWGQEQVTDASLLIVLCADLNAWQKEPVRYWRNAPKDTQEMIVPLIGNYYRGKKQVQRDEAMRSCGMAAQTLMLAATAMGYESCPMDGFDFEQVGKLINLPEDHVISMFVVIGKGIKEAWPRPGQLGAGEVIITDKF